MRITFVTLAALSLSTAQAAKLSKNFTPHHSHSLTAVQPEKSFESTSAMGDVKSLANALENSEKEEKLLNEINAEIKDYWKMASQSQKFVQQEDTAKMQILANAAHKQHMAKAQVLPKVVKTTLTQQKAKSTDEKMPAQSELQLDDMDDSVSYLQLDEDQNQAIDEVEDVQLEDDQDQADEEVEDVQLGDDENIEDEGLEDIQLEDDQDEGEDETEDIQLEDDQDEANEDDGDDQDVQLEDDQDEVSDNEDIELDEEYRVPTSLSEMKVDIGKNLNKAEQFAEYAVALADEAKHEA